MSCAVCELWSKPRRPARGPESTSTSSSDAPGVSPPDFLVVAQVLAPHGLRGELKCRVITDFPEQRFKRGATLRIRGEAHTVRSARVQGGVVLLKLAGVADRNAAERFRGADIEVAVQDALELPAGQFYWHQVIGLEVEDATTHESLGRVTDILETGANDVYVVRGPNGESLIPAIREVIKEIDPVRGRMLIEPLPGLLPRRAHNAT
ncbi:MAG TPA: ribosome maturation factor RimM [Chloroflexota bacterium]